MTVVVIAKAARYAAERLVTFKNPIESMRVVQGADRPAGSFDCTKKLAMPDIDARDAAYKWLGRKVKPRQISSGVAIETLKKWALPLREYAGDRYLRLS